MTCTDIKIPRRPRLGDNKFCISELKIFFGIQFLFPRRPPQEEKKFFISEFKMFEPYSLYYFF